MLFNQANNIETAGTFSNDIQNGIINARGLWIVPFLSSSTNETFFRKTQALSYQKTRKDKNKNACGLMAENRHTHTHTQVMTPPSTSHVNR